MNQKYPSYVNQNMSRVSECLNLLQVFSRGVGLSTHSDSELITQTLCLNPPVAEDNGPDWTARIRNLMKVAPLSYSLVLMEKDKIYGVRDPYGNRPLCIGKIVPVNTKSGNFYVTLL